MIKKQPNINLGAATLFALFVLLFFIVLLRYFSIEITGEAAGQPLAAKAKQKYNRTGVLEAQRGTILDRNGDIVAEDSSAYNLIAILSKKMTTDPKHPMNVVDPAKTANELAKYINLSESEIYSILTRKQFQVEFGSAGKDLSSETKQKIENLHLPGITFTRDPKRYYPNGIFSSHVVGYADSVEKNGSYKTVGEMGIEKEFNKELTGVNGQMDYQSDIWGYLLPNNKPKITPAKNGDDIYLTIDTKIQTFIEDALNKVDQEYKPKNMIAIVADPKTGEILGMGQRPDFTPNTKDGIDQSWQNLAIETSFEPGSTMKTFTLSAAVQENVFNPNETYPSGKYMVTPQSPPVYDWNRGGWGNITFLEGVQRSSNVAFARIAAEKLGFDRYRQYLSKFGFDKPTGIELPNEASGKILYNYPIEKANTAFGQGTAITPIQQIQAATAVANDGEMMKPHVVERIVNHDTGKTIHQTKPEVAGTPISADTAKKVRDILETVVTSPKGTGSRYKIAGYSVAGKTGTAQIPDSKGGGYLTGPSNYVFSFLGMAPKDDPKLIVYVAVQQPNVDDYTKGSIPVSEIFDPVMENSLQYLNIQPAKQQKPNANQIEDFNGQPVDMTVKNLKAQGFNPVVLGKGTKVVAQLPKAGETILDGEKIILQTDGGLLAPDMTGWSLRDCMKVAQLAGLKFGSTGNGYVNSQNIKAGTPLHNGDTLMVELVAPEDLLKNQTPANKDGTGNKNGG